jgi:hypothetical protein
VTDRTIRARRNADRRRSGLCDFGPSGARRNPAPEVERSGLVSALALSPAIHQPDTDVWRWKEGEGSTTTCRRLAPFRRDPVWAYGRGVRVEVAAVAGSITGHAGAVCQVRVVVVYARREPPPCPPLCEG